MTKFDIGGMSCAACSARVEKTVSALDGVTHCSVNLLTGTMELDGTASVDAVISAVENIGYTASLHGQKEKNTTQSKHSDTRLLLYRFLYSLVFLVILMYISMGHVMWGWYLPEFLAQNPMTLALCELLLSATVIVINQKFFISGTKAVLHKSPNMDTLVSLGSGTSFVYSCYLLFEISSSVFSGNINHAFHLLHGLYFESAAMILALITLGKMLESYSKGKTANALNSLIDLAPKKASLIKDGAEITVDADSLKPGDVIAVRPGESFAADGVVIEGMSSVDESALTGESIPVDKAADDRVYTATVNKSGFLKVRVTHTGEESSLSRIIAMVSDASASKAPIARIADKVSAIFVPSVIAIAAVTLVIWLALGKDIGFSLARSISVLVISCPCALGLATPVAIMVASGKGAKSGILFKNAASLENLGKADIVVFDKTGTLTNGTPVVTDILCRGIQNENELLKIAASLEQKSEHPLSHAIVSKAKEENVALTPTDEFKIHPGNGISAVINGEAVYGGSFSYISSVCTDDTSHISHIQSELASLGKTPLYFATKTKLLGIIAVADTIKDDAISSVDLLHKMGIKTVMLTGDNKLPAQKIAAEIGIDTVIAQVLPDEKANNINSLKSQGRVVMVGDGIHDAPSLTTADIVIAVAHGTDIAIESADVVLMKNSLFDIPAAINLSRSCLKNIKENLFWAFIYNIIGIPLAAGVFISLFGWELTPMFGAAAMSLSSFCVVSNALRLNLAKIYKNNKSNTKQRKEVKLMKKTIRIEGMMCPHCEARVKQLLEQIDGVESAATSHKEGTAVVSLTKEVADDVLAKVISDAGYKVV